MKEYTGKSSDVKPKNAPYGSSFYETDTNDTYFKGYNTDVNNGWSKTNTLNLRAATIVSSATPTPNVDDVDMFTVSLLSTNTIFGAPLGTPVDGQGLLYRVTSDATIRTIGWNAIFRASTDFALPVATVASKTFYLQYVYNAAAVKWDATGLTRGF